MKTYNLLPILLGCLIMGCSKSELETEEKAFENIAITYSVMIKDGNETALKDFSGDGETLKEEDSQNAFSTSKISDIENYIDDSYSFYSKDESCIGNVYLYNLETDELKSNEVFSDIGACNLEVSGISHSSNHIFVSYQMELVGVQKYFVRTIDVKSANWDFVDIEISQKAVEMALSGERLFVLTRDEEGTKEYAVSVINVIDNTKIHSNDLGANAKQIFKIPNGNVVISYDDKHTVINHSTFSEQYIRYSEGTEPKFSDSATNYFDATGAMYFLRPDTGDIPLLAAIYDFEENNTTIYDYNNMFSSAQINFDFKIGTTTAVGYDEKNKILIIGYQKSDDTNKGGILRIRTSPEIQFVDNTNINGVPHVVISK